MKKVIVLISAIVIPLISGAQPVPPNSNISVIRNQLGIGDPAPFETLGSSQLIYINDNYYHSPQYMPGFPTSATIWPRVVDINCEKSIANVVCDGYHWQPSYGRGEYLFVHPNFKSKVTDKPPQIVYIEVPIKKKKE